MADVRSLLRNERNARRISHPHATYSTTGTLVCLVCHIQLKSESLWNGHLRSAQHAMRLQRIRDGTLGRPPGAPAPESRQREQDEEDKTDGGTSTDAADDLENGVHVTKSSKRKADDGEERVRKRSKADGFPEENFEGSVDDSETIIPSKNGPSSGQEIQLPSRPATPSKTAEGTKASKAVIVDEDEWAAFEADIAATEAPIVEDAIISAPAMSTAELAAKSKEEEIAQRKERQEAELEGDKEDAARKLEDELTEMEALEERIKKLKEKREALRLKGTGGNTAAPLPQEAPAAKTDIVGVSGGLEDGEEDADDDDDDDDDWDGFRLKA